MLLRLLSGLKDCYRILGNGLKLFVEPGSPDLFLKEFIILTEQPPLSKCLALMATFFTVRFERSPAGKSTLALHFPEINAVE